MFEMFRSIGMKDTRIVKFECMKKYIDYFLF